jgi:hypothetical protein
VAYLAVIPENESVGDVKRVFDEIRREKRIPFVPNFFKTLAHAPQSLEATWMAYRGLTWHFAIMDNVSNRSASRPKLKKPFKKPPAARLQQCSWSRDRCPT